MEILEKKLRRQNIGIDRWVHGKDHGAPRNGCGTLHWYTAVGKTFAALLICQRMFERHPEATVLVIVPSDSLRTQWKDEIKKNIPREYWENFDVATIHMLIEHKLRFNVDLEIADEIHEYLTDERIKYLDGTEVKYKWNLGLTATWEDSQGRHKRLQDICPVVDRITEDEALREGYISKFIEYNVPVQLTPDEAVTYKHYSDLMSKFLSRFNKSLAVAQLCLQGGVDADGNIFTAFGFCTGWAKKHGWYPGGNFDDPEYAQLDAEWNPTKVLAYARHVMDSIRKRKDVIYNAENKIHEALKLVFKYPELKTICFSQSTTFADKLGLLINKADPNSCVVYHSQLATIVTVDGNGKKKKKGKTILKREAIEKIRSGEARRISTASALDRGFDVVDIRMGITTSGTKNPTQHSQRSGRVKRLELYAQDVTVLVVNFYIPNSVDEKWLRNRQKKSAHTVYWVNSVDNVNYNPVDKKSFTFNQI